MSSIVVRPPIRVFVSSTFRDMHAERDLLVTVVFPELRERLESLGLDFFDVDLRWGVPEKGVDGEKANPWEYCKKWIERVEPFFVSLLGQRYGSVPPASEIKDPSERERWRNLSITEMEIRHAVLEREGLYRRSYFYLRRAEVPRPPAVSPEVYAEFVDVDNQSDLEQLKTLIRATSRPVRGYACDWVGDHFENLDEFGRMVLEDLWSGVLRDTRYVPTEAWRAALGHEPDGDSAYRDNSAPVPQALWEKLVEYARPMPRDPLQAEADQMATFAASRLRWFKGRREEIKALQRFVRQASAPQQSRLCVVAGPPGQGKTALLARFARDMREMGARVIEHYVGATEASASQRSLLLRLIRELERTEPEGTPWEARDLPELQRRLADCLRDYSGDKPLVLMIDGINQLTDGRDLRWLPSQVGDKVRIVVSCVEDASIEVGSAEAEVLGALRVRRPEPIPIPVDRLDPTSVRQVVVEYLDEYCKELDQTSIDRICSMPQATNPLYLFVMLGELRTLGGNDMNRRVPELLSKLDGEYPDTVRLFGWVLERLHVFGKKAVALWCAYLSLGRVGMSSRELRDLLERRLGEAGGRAALRIERGLRRYLLHRGLQLDFFHIQLRRAVERRYLSPGGAFSANKLHRDVADYFADQWKTVAGHPLNELPYHLIQARLSRRVQDLLSHSLFLQRKLDSTGPQPLIEDFMLFLEAASKRQSSRTAVLAYIYRALLMSSHVLARHPAQLPTQLWGRLRGHGAQVQRLLESFRTSSPRPWLRPLGGSLITVRSRLRRTFQDSQLFTASVTRDGRNVISVSLGHVVTVWDVRSGQVLSRHTLPRLESAVTTYVVSPDTRSVLTGSEDGAVLVWDADEDRQRTLGRHDAPVQALCMTQDGRYVISGSEDHTIGVWDRETEGGRILRGHKGPITALCAVSNARVVSASEDGTLRVWNLATGEGKVVSRGNKDVSALCRGRGGGVHTASSCEIAALCLTPDHQCLVMGSPRGTLEIDSVDGRGMHVTIEAHSGVIVSVSASAHYVVSASWNGEIKVWNLNDLHAEEALLANIEVGEGPIHAVSMSPDGRRAVSAALGGSLTVWSLRTGNMVCSLQGSKHDVTAMGMTPDGKRLVSGTRHGTLKLWSLQSGRVIRTSSSPRAHRTLARWIESIHVMPDGQHVWTCARDGRLTLWDLKAWRELRRIRTARGQILKRWKACVLPSGTKALVGMWGVYLWDLRTGRSLRKLETRDISAIGVSRDGRRAVWGLIDGSMCIWDLEAMRPVSVFEAHTGTISAVGLTTDGRHGVSASEDRTIKLWDLDRGSELAVFEGDAELLSCTIAPGGQTIVAGDLFGSVHLLRVEGPSTERRSNSKRND